MPHMVPNQRTNTILADRALVPKQPTLDALPLVSRRPMVEGHLQVPKQPTELERCHLDHTQHMEARYPRPQEDMITQDDEIPSLENNTVYAVSISLVGAAPE